MMISQNNIEIKIWAEINGFIEISDGIVDKSLLMKSELCEFNIEKFNKLNSNIGFCSIFYASNSYVLGYHFLSNDTQKILSHQDTVIVVVVRRGFKLVHPFDVLSKLRQYYEAVLSNQDKGDRELGFDIRQKLPMWEEELDGLLEKDDMQPIVNLPGNTSAKGYVTCKTSTEMGRYLDNPFRMDFQGAQLMLFLPKETLKDASHNTIISSFQHVTPVLIYRHQYFVYFPAYQSEPIAIIYSLDETIDMTFEKPYCLPICLSGRYSEHIHDWKIERTSDNTGYNIGLQFKEQELRYKINVTFVNLKNNVVKANNVSSWLQVSSGHIVSDENGDWLVLKASQKDFLSQIRLTSNREDYLVTRYSVVESQFNLRVDEVFYFDVLKLKSFIERKYHFSPQVCLLNDARQWIAYETRVPLKGDFSQDMVKIAESDEYEEVIFSMSQDVNEVQFKKKPRMKLTVLFEGEILRWLKVDESRNVTVKETALASGKSKGYIPLEFSVNLSNNELELPPVRGNKRYCFKASGFKTEYRDLDAKTTEIKLNMHKVWWKKPFASKIQYVFAGIIVGYFLGCYLPFYGNEQKKHVIADTLSSESSDSLQNYEVEDTDTFNSHDFSQPEQQNQPEQERQESQSESPVESSKPVQPQEDKKTRYSSELSALMEKLKGIEFTEKDVDKAKILAQKERLLKIYHKLFKACDFALRVVSDKHKNALFVKIELEKYTLQPEQKDAILKLIKDENVYNADTKTYKNLKEMLIRYRYS